MPCEWFFFLGNKSAFFRLACPICIELLQDAHLELATFTEFLKEKASWKRQLQNLGRTPPEDLLSQSMFDSLFLPADRFSAHIHSSWIKTESVGPCELLKICICKEEYCLVLWLLQLAFLSEATHSETDMKLKRNSLQLFYQNPFKTFRLTANKVYRWHKNVPRVKKKIKKLKICQFCGPISTVCKLGSFKQHLLQHVWNHTGTQLFRKHRLTYCRSKHFSRFLMPKGSWISQ